MQRLRYLKQTIKDSFWNTQGIMLRFAENTAASLILIVGVLVDFQKTSYDT